MCANPWCEPGASPDVHRAGGRGAETAGRAQRDAVVAGRAGRREPHGTLPFAAGIMDADGNWREFCSGANHVVRAGKRRVVDDATTTTRVGGVKK